LSADTSKNVIDIEDLHLHFQANHVLKGISLPVKERRVTAIIGPSGSGKSSLLRCLNRMVDLTDDSRTEGSITFSGRNILAEECNVVRLRQEVGMVFQKPNPFPRSIFDNVAYGPRLRGVRRQNELGRVVEDALRGAALWDEVKDRLTKPAMDLSGGQQQRLCIARALAVRPAVLLMDEPCSALDPAATTKIEDLIEELRREMAVVLVTHNLQQAARASDYTVFLLDGRLVEWGPTEKMFTRPDDERTDAYVTGRFG